MEVPLLGQAQAQARDTARKQEDEPRVIDAVTAFIICILPDGQVIMEPGLDTMVTTERAPTLHDVIAGCTNAAQDITRARAVQEVTVNVLGNLSRLLASPEYQAAVEQARQQARFAAAAAGAS